MSLYSRRKRHFSPLPLIGLCITVLLIVSGTAVFVLSRARSHAAAANPNCTLIIPANPLSAQGLATPYQLVAADNNGPCNEVNANQSAFVQGVIYDPANGKFSVYSPLVIDKGTQPAVQPTVPTLPANAVVGLWFGFNGTNLTLRGSRRNALAQGHCVNGTPGSVFGQFAYCNASAFFTAANNGQAQGKFTIPPIGMANDGMPCLTSRDFGLIDQDQSDNVQTQYLANGQGQIAQFSVANQQQLANATAIANPSDNALLTHFVDPVLGCTPWQVPDLADNGAMVSALPLDEIQAAADQKAPMALVPLTDPMVLHNANQSLRKTNLYRLGVDQTQAANTNQANGTTYCQNFATIGLVRLKLDQTLTQNAASPMPAAANSLFTFLAQRFNASYTNLNCQNLLNQPNPVTVQTDGNGVAIGATFGNGNNGNGNGNQGNGNGKHGKHGDTANGTTANGTTANVTPTNDTTTNTTTTNGTPTNTTTTNTTTTNTTTTNGTPTNGTMTNGTMTNGTMTNGTPTNGGGGNQ